MIKGLPEELQFPLRKLWSFHKPEVVALLTRDIVEPDTLRSSLWDRISEHGGALAHFVFESAEPLNFAFRSGAEFQAAVAKDLQDGYALSGDCYFTAGDVIGYSSTRDTFAILVVPEALLRSGELADWDRRFTDHVNETGVGFGDEGRAYLSGLLVDLDQPRHEGLLASLRLS